MIFIGYNPYAPPRTTPAHAGDLPDVPASRLEAAERAGAGWLSADGLRCYRDDRGGPEVAFWNAEAGNFLSWWNVNEVPADAVRIP